MKYKTKLMGSKRLTPQEFFKSLQTYSEINNFDFDFYGSGNSLSSFEREIADFFDKEEAIFMPSGTMAQLIALKVHSEKSKHPIGFHPLSHLELHEQSAYTKLHNLDVKLIGESSRYLSLSDIKKYELSTILYEIPQREIGGELPSFNELTEISKYCRENNITIHMDGARLWEVQPFYNKTYKEIASLFDSIYVSFYKGLNAVSGAMLIGNKDLIQESRVWLRRHGGNLIHLYPLYLSCKKSFEENLGKMPHYHQRAIEIAEILNTSDLIKTNPKVPQSNMFHILFKEETEVIKKKIESFEKDFETFLFHPPQKNKYLSEDFVSVSELSIGDYSLNYPLDQLREIISLYF